MHHYRESFGQWDLNYRNPRVFNEMMGNFLYLALTNTSGGKKKKSFRSTKGEGHGFGISRMDAVVKKYGGYITRASEDEAFSTEVLLPQ